MNRMRNDLGSKRSVALGLVALIAVFGIAPALGEDDPQKGHESGEGGQVTAWQAGAGWVRPPVDGIAGKPERPSDGNKDNAKPTHRKPVAPERGTAKLESPTGKPIAGATGGAPADSKSTRDRLGHVAGPGSDGAPDRGTAKLEPPAGEPVAEASGGTADLKPGPSTQPVGQVAKPDSPPDGGKEGLPPETDHGVPNFPPTEDGGDRGRK